jgi:hypothetical protein
VSLLRRIHSLWTGSDPRPLIHPPLPRMDEDVETMTRDQLAAEVRRLRQGIRAHRDSSEHELCWHHPQLWGLLPEKSDPQPVVPAWPQFMRGCIRYRQSLDAQLPDAPRTEQPYPGGA